MFEQTNADTRRNPTNSYHSMYFRYVGHVERGQLIACIIAGAM